VVLSSGAFGRYGIGKVRICSAWGKWRGRSCLLFLLVTGLEQWTPWGSVWLKVVRALIVGLLFLGCLFEPRLLWQIYDETLELWQRADLLQFRVYYDL